MTALSDTEFVEQTVHRLREAEATPEGLPPILDSLDDALAAGKITVGRELKAIAQKYTRFQARTNNKANMVKDLTAHYRSKCLDRQRRLQAADAKPF